MRKNRIILYYILTVIAILLFVFINNYKNVGFSRTTIQHFVFILGFFPAIILAWLSKIHRKVILCALGVLIITVLNSVLVDDSWLSNAQMQIWAKKLKPTIYVEESLEKIPENKNVSASILYRIYSKRKFPSILPYPLSNKNTIYYLYAHYKNEINYDKVAFMRLLQDGFYPCSQHWKQGYFVLSRECDTGKEPLLQALANETQAGFNFQRKNHTWWMNFFAGLSVPEKDGRWSDQNTIVFCFRNLYEVGTDMILQLVAQHPIHYLPQQTISLYINDEEFDILANPDPLIRYSRQIPREMLKAEVNLLTIKLQHTFVPAEIGLANDRRKLGLKLQFLGFMPEEGQQ